MEDGDIDTDLHIASMHGHTDKVIGLLKAGAEVDSNDGFGTPLYHASVHGHINTVKVLLDAGADVNKKFTDRTVSTLYSVTSLAVTVFDLQRHHVLEKLVAIIQMLLDYGAKADDTDVDGHTPLYVASKGGSTEVVLMLLHAGAHVNYVTPDGHTSLYVAAKKGRIEVVEILLSGGAYVNYIAHDGHTPLSIAAQEGHLEVVSILLSAGALTTDMSDEMP